MKKIHDYINSAYQGNWALGQFNISSLEVLQGAIQAAESLKSPIIIGTSMGTINHFGFDYVKSMIDEGKRQATIPMFVHLDHGTYDMAIRCIEAGYDSVMIDASEQSFEENVRIVKEIVKLGHRHGIEVEGQIGRTFDEEGKKEVEVLDTDPEEAAEFVKRTGIDYVAVQIGNTPGQKGVANIDLTSLKKIHETIHIPIVLHGGSSISSETIQRVRRLGIAKVNIDRILRDAIGKAMKSYYSTPRDLVDPRIPMKHGRSFVYEEVQNKIIEFGSNNKAKAVNKK